MNREQSRGTRALDVANQLRRRLVDLRTEAHTKVDDDFDSSIHADPIPRAVKLTAGWAVRLVGIGLGVWLLLWLLSYLAIVVVPLVVSLLVAA